jgi:hypothetical protein
MNLSLLTIVMAGLDPAIHASAAISEARCRRVDGRIKSGHDGVGVDG